jgi:hypothetical protein
VQPKRNFLYIGQQERVGKTFYWSYCKVESMKSTAVASTLCDLCTRPASMRTSTVYACCWNMGHRLVSKLVSVPVALKIIQCTCTQCTWYFFFLSFTQMVTPDSPTDVVVRCRYSRLPCTICKLFLVKNESSAPPSCSVCLCGCC